MNEAIESLEWSIQSYKHYIKDELDRIEREEQQIGFCKNRIEDAHKKIRDAEVHIDAFVAAIEKLREDNA
jgi:hypothetical protein